MASNDSNEGNDTAAQAAFQVGDRVRWEHHYLSMPYAREGTVISLDPFGNPFVRSDSGGNYMPLPERLTLISRATPASAPAQTFAPGQRVCVVGWRYPGSGKGTVIEPSDRWGPGHVEIAFDDGDTARGVYLPEQLAPICLRCGGYLDEDQRAAHAELCYRCQLSVAADVAYASAAPAPAPAHPFWPPAPHRTEPANALWKEHVVRTRMPAATPPALDTHTLEMEVQAVCSGCGGGKIRIEHTERETIEGPCPVCHGSGWARYRMRLSDEAVDRLAAALAKRLPGIARMRDGGRY